MSMSPDVVPVVVASRPVSTLSAVIRGMELAPDDLIELAPLIRGIAAHPTRSNPSLVRAKHLLTTPAQEESADPEQLMNLLSLLRDFARQQAG